MTKWYEAKVIRVSDKVNAPLGARVAVSVAPYGVRVWSNGFPYTLKVAEAQEVLATIRPLVEVRGIEAKWSLYHTQ